MKKLLFVLLCLFVTSPVFGDIDALLECSCTHRPGPNESADYNVRFHYVEQEGFVKLLVGERKGKIWTDVISKVVAVTDDFWKYKINSVDVSLIIKKPIPNFGMAIIENGVLDLGNGKIVRLVCEEI